MLITRPPVPALPLLGSHPQVLPHPSPSITSLGTLEQCPLCLCFLSLAQAAAPEHLEGRWPPDPPPCSRPQPPAAFHYPCNKRQVQGGPGCRLAWVLPLCPATAPSAPPRGDSGAACRPTWQLCPHLLLPRAHFLLSGPLGGSPRASHSHSHCCPGSAPS